MCRARCISSLYPSSRRLLVMNLASQACFGVGTNCSSSGSKSACWSYNYDTQKLPSAENEIKSGDYQENVKRERKDWKRGRGKGKGEEQDQAAASGVVNIASRAGMDARRRKTRHDPPSKLAGTPDDSTEWRSPALPTFDSLSSGTDGFSGDGPKTRASSMWCQWGRKSATPLKYWWSTSVLCPVRRWWQWWRWWRRWRWG